MKAPRHILHPTDLSLAARPAFVEALGFARTFGAVLHLLHVAPTFGEDPLRNAFKAALDEQAFYDALKREMDERMRAIISVHDVEGIDIRQVQLRGDSTAGAIRTYAEAEGIDLIVMGTHGHRGLRKFVLGSVTSEVVRTVSCDVLTIRNVTGLPASRDGFERMLVPVDLTPGSKKLLKEATDLAALLKMPVTVLHVVEAFPLPTWPIGDDMLNDLIPSRINYAREQLESQVKEVLGVSANVETALDEGKPADCIVEYADNHQCDLIVMATRDSGWFDHLPLGSVAGRVMATSNHPVYMTHLPAEQEEKAGADEEAPATA